MVKQEDITFIDLTSSSDDGSEDVTRLEMRWDSNTEEILHKAKKWIGGVLSSAKYEKRLYTYVKITCKLLIVLSSVLNILSKHFSTETYITIIMNSIVLLANNVPDIFGVEEKISSAEKTINNCINFLISIDCELKKHKKDRLVCDQFILNLTAQMKELLNLGADSIYV